MCQGPGSTALNTLPLRWNPDTRDLDWDTENKFASSSLVSSLGSSLLTTPPLLSRYSSPHCAHAHPTTTGGLPGTYLGCGGQRRQWTEDAEAALIQVRQGSLLPSPRRPVSEWPRVQRGKSEGTRETPWPPAPPPGYKSWGPEIQ